MSTWVYTVSQGDINNGNIRFADCPFPIRLRFIGGTNDDEAASERLRVTFVPGDTSEQWLCSDKKIFNNRNPITKDFFTSIGAVKGTKIAITQNAPNSLIVPKVVS